MFLLEDPSRLIQACGQNACLSRRIWQRKELAQKSLGGFDRRCLKRKLPHNEELNAQTWG